MEIVACSLELSACTLSRVRKIPRRLEDNEGSSAGYIARSTEEDYRQKYFEFLDIVITGITVC